MRQRRTPRLIRSRCFDVYCFPPSDTNEPEVAKCAHAGSTAGRDSLRSEYASLRDVNRRAGVALAGTIPRPICFQEKESVLRMSAVPGIPLSQILRRRANIVWGSVNRRPMRHFGRELGKWLHAFHDATDSGTQVHNHLAFMKEFDADLVRSSKWLSAPGMEQARSRAESLSSSLDGAVLRMAAVHGDFTPQNILFEGVRPGIVDFASYRPSAPIYWDLSTFAAYGALLASKLKYHSGALQDLLKNFLTGYGGNWSPDLLAMFASKAVLTITSDGPDPALASAARQRIERVLLGVADPNSWLGQILAQFRGQAAAADAVTV